MPRGDGTGPMGMGPMTGRGAGLCGGFAVPGAMNNSGGLGVCRRGGGRMMRSGGFSLNNRFMGQQNVSATVPAANEKEFLTNQAKFLEKQLEQVKQRLGGVSSESD